MSKLRCGTKVRDRREQLGISREKLAATADVSTSTVARLELENRIPSTINLLRIARVIDLTLDDLMSDELEASA